MKRIGVLLLTAILVMNMTAGNFSNLMSQVKAESSSTDDINHIMIDISDIEDFEDKLLYKEVVSNSSFLDMTSELFSEVLYATHQGSYNTIYERSYRPYSASLGYVGHDHTSEPTETGLYYDNPQTALDAVMRDFGVTSSQAKVDSMVESTRLPDEEMDTFVNYYDFTYYAGKTWYGSDIYVPHRDVIIIYDFSVVPLADELQGETDGLEIGDDMPDSDDVPYTYEPSGEAAVFHATNPNYESMEVSKEYTYDRSIEVTHETSTELEKNFETSTMVGATIEFPIKAATVGGTVESTYTYSIGTVESWTNSTTEVTNESVSDSITVPLEPHTSIDITQTGMNALVSVSYEGKFQINYRLAMVRIQEVHKDNNSIGEYECTIPLLNLDDEENGIEDLDTRISQKDMVDVNGTPIGNDAIDWNEAENALEDVPVDYLTYNIPAVEVTGEYTCNYKGTSIEPDEIAPLYNLNHIIPDVDAITMYEGETYSLDAIMLNAYNRYDIAYYGFAHREDGEWQIVDREGNPDDSIAEIVPGLNCDVIMPNAVGETYLKFVLNDSIEDIENAGDDKIVDYHEQVNSYLVPIEVKPTVLSNVTLSGALEPIFLNDGDNKVDFSHLELRALDEEGLLTTPSALVYKLDEAFGAVMDSDAELVTAQEAGTYHIYALANGEESNRIAFTVYPERHVEALSLTGEIPELEWYNDDNRVADLTALLTVEAVDQYGDRYLVEEDEYTWLVGSSGEEMPKSTVQDNLLIALSEGMDSLTLMVDDVLSTPIFFNVKEKPYMTALSVMGEIPNLVWNDDEKNSVDLTEALAIQATDQYGEAYPLKDSDYEWFIGSADSGDVKSIVNGNTLVGKVVGTDSVNLKVGDFVSDTFTFTIQASPYMDELLYSGGAEEIEPEVDYDLSLVPVYALDQYGEPLALTDDEIADLEWEVDEDSEAMATISGGMLTIEEEMISGETSSVTLSATLEGSVKTCTVKDIVITVKAIPELTTIVITPPEGFELKLYENANLSTFTLTAYDQYGDSFDISEEEVVWTSSDSGIIEVTDEDTIVGHVIDQSVVLTATVDGLVSEALEMMVYGTRKYSILSIVGAPDTVDIGDTLDIGTLETYTYDQYGTAVEVDGELEWTMEAGDTEGVMTEGVIDFGSTAGVVTLSAAMVDSSGDAVNEVIGFVTIEVVRELTALEITDAPSSIKKNNSLDLDDLTVTCYDQMGAEMSMDDLGGELIWTLDAGSTDAELTDGSLSAGSTTGTVTLTAYIEDSESGVAINEVSDSVTITIKSSSSSSGSSGSSSSSSSSVSVLTITDETIALSGEFSLKSEWDDVGADHWAYMAITTLSGLGHIDGRTESMFMPGEPITRAEYTAYMVNVTGLYDGTAEDTFEDVDDDSPYAQHIASAYSQDLVTGYSDTEFRPDATITRQEAVTILLRAMALREEKYDKVWTEAAFLDQTAIEPYAVNAVNGAAALGLVKGYKAEAGFEFRPLAEMSRAEAAQILYMLYSLE